MSTAPTQRGIALHDCRCPRPPGIEAVYSTNSTANCPEVGAEEWVERAGKDVVARGRQEPEGAGCVPRGEQGKAYAGDREVVSPREEPMRDGDGVLTEGKLALRRGGLGIGLVGDKQGTRCVGQGVVDLEARVGQAYVGFLQGGEPPHRSRQPSADRPAAASSWCSRASSQVTRWE